MSLPELDDEKPTIDLGWMGVAIGYRLRQAQDASFQAFCRTTGDPGLRPGRFAILQIIDRNPGISQTAISRTLNRDKSTLSPVIADLQRRGLLVRKTDPTDGRGRRLTLTDKGRGALKGLTQHAINHDERLNKLFTDQQRRQLMAYLITIAEALHDGNEPAPYHINED